MTTEGNVAKVIPLHTPLTEAPDTLIAVDDSLDVGAVLGQPLENTVCFGDDIWNLDGHDGLDDKTSSTFRKLDFGRVPSLWRPLTKMFALLRLDPAGAAVALKIDVTKAVTTIDKAKPSTVAANVRFVGMVLTRFEANNLHSVSKDGWGQVTVLLKTSPDGNTYATKTSRILAQAVVDLHHTGLLVKWPSPFGSQPWNSQPLSKVFPQSGTESQGLNVTRPTTDVFNVNGVAIFIIQELGPNILEHVKWWTDAHRANLNLKDSPAVRDKLVEAYKDQGRQHGAVAGNVNPAFGLVLASGAMRYSFGENLPIGHTRFNRLAVEAVMIASEQLTEEGVIDEPLTPRVGVSPCPILVKEFTSHKTGDPVPWSNTLLWDPDGLCFWVGALVHSVMYYVCAMTGMRDKDRDLLGVGCVTTEQRLEVNGDTTELFWLNGWKQKNVAVKTRMKLPINGDIKNAIGLVEELHELLDIEAKPFDHDPSSHALFDSALNIWQPPGGPRRAKDRLYLEKDWVERLKGAAGRLFDAGVVPQSIDDVQKLSIRQTRITAMHAFADRSYGDVAAAVMGNWSSQKVMNGYVGDVARQFVPDNDNDQEVKKAIEVARGRRIEHLVASETEVFGAGVPKLNGLVDRHPDLLGGEAVPANLLRLSNKDRQKLGKAEANLETGMFTDCFYKQTGALCGGEGQADFRTCRPGKCGNSVMTEAHVAAVELGRRIDEKHPALATNAALVEEDLGDVLGPFKNKTDGELRQIIDDDNNRYLERVCETGDDS